MAIAAERLTKSRMKALRQEARRVRRAEERADMTPENTRISLMRTEEERKRCQREVINNAWTRTLGDTQEATLTTLRARNKTVKRTIDASLLSASAEASLFWTGMLGKEIFTKPAAITVTDTDLNGQTQQRRIMIERRRVGSSIFPFPGEQTVINSNPNFGVIYQATV